MNVISLLGLVICSVILGYMLRTNLPTREDRANKYLSDFYRQFDEYLIEELGKAEYVRISKKFARKGTEEFMRTLGIDEDEIQRCCDITEEDFNDESRKN